MDQLERAKAAWVIWWPVIRGILIAAVVLFAIGLALNANTEKCSLKKKLTGVSAIDFESVQEYQECVADQDYGGFAGP